MSVARAENLDNLVNPVAGSCDLSDAAFYKEFIEAAIKEGWYSEGGDLAGKQNDDLCLYEQVAGADALEDLKRGLYNTYGDNSIGIGQATLENLGIVPPVAPVIDMDTHRQVSNPTPVATAVLASASLPATRCAAPVVSSGATSATPASPAALHPVTSGTRPGNRGGNGGDSGGNGGGGGGNGGNNGNGNGGNRPGFLRRNARRIAIGAAATVAAVGLWLGVGANNAGNQHRADAAALDAMNNTPGNVQTIDGQTTFGENVEGLTELGVSFDEAVAHLQGRVDNPNGAWWNLFDGLQDPDVVNTALESAPTTADDILIQTQQEQVNLDIQNAIDGIKSSFDALDPDLSDEERLTAINALLAGLDTQNEANTNNPDDAKDFLQGQIDALRGSYDASKADLQLRISASKYNVSPESLKQFALEHGIPLSELNSANVGEYLVDGIDSNWSNNVSESYNIENVDTEYVRDQIAIASGMSDEVFAMYQYAISSNGNNGNDGLVDGFLNPADLNELLSSYEGDSALRDADFTSFLEQLEGADIKIVDATGALGMSYARGENGKLVAVSVSDLGGNPSGKLIQVVFKNGAQVYIKPGCMQTWIGAKSSVVYNQSSVATPTASGSFTWNDSHYQEPVVDETTPDTKEPCEPTTPGGPELEKKDPTESIIKPGDTGSHDSSADDATVSHKEASTPGGDNSGNSDAGQDVGNESQPEDPSQGEGFDWNS